MTTFRDWLRDQEKREDQVGMVAQLWRDLPDTPRLSSPASIERHMRERGLFDTTPGLPEAWELLIHEYREGRILEAASAAGVEVQQRAPLPPGQVPLLERIDAKLDALLSFFGIGAGGTDEPIDWQALWDAADHEAAAG